MTDPHLDSTTPSFGHWLTAIMRERGLTQAEIARRIGVDDAQVSRWRRFRCRFPRCLVPWYL